MSPLTQSKGSCYEIFQILADDAFCVRVDRMRLVVRFFIRLRRIPRACPWMNAQMPVVLRRDVAPTCHAVAAAKAEAEADNHGVAEGEDG